MDGKRKYAGALGLTLLLILAGFSLNVFAAVSFTRVTDSTVFDGRYSFSPRYISGKTEMEPFGGYNYDEDLWNTDHFNTDSVTPVRLTETNKGKIGAIYKNVGEYQGKIIDLKITLSDWKQLRAMQTVKGKKSYPTVFFLQKSIGFWVTDNMVKSPKFKLEFLDAENGLAVSVTGHQSFTDIDLGQFVESSDLSEGFLSSDTCLSVTGNKVYSQPDTGDVATEDKRYWITGFFENKIAYSFIFSTQKYEEADFSLPLTDRGVDQLSLTGETFAPFDTPTPIKNADRSEMYRNETVNYSFKFTTPQESKDYYYTGFALEDVLPEPLRYVDGSFSAVDDGGNGATDRFSVSLTEQKLLVKGKETAIAEPSFYNRTYTLNIKAKIKAGYAFDDFAGDKGGRVNLENRVSLTTKSAARKETTKKSNPVNTEVKFRIDTGTDGHGVITDSITKIPGGEDRTVIYSPNPGYRLAKVLVDGKQMDIVQHEDKYVFPRIYDDHVIRAEFTPITDNRITVTKRVDSKDVYQPYGAPVAIFRLSGLDVNGKFREYHRAATLDDRTLSSGAYTAVLTFDHLTAGTYTLEEIQVSRYQTAEISDLRGGKRSGDKIEFDLLGNRTGACTYTNSLENYSLFSHCDLVVNTF